MELKKALDHYYGFQSFRMGQEEIITDLFKGSDVLGMLPTGTGKTLIYQLATLLLKGKALIVSPLVSLMQDQVEQFKMAGFKRTTALNSFLDQTEKQLVLKRIQDYQFVFVSPEILQSDYIRKVLGSVQWSLFVVDEAHCISQWGHEFRPHYLDLAKMKKEFGDPPCLALTATATKQVQRDILSNLEMRNAKVHVYSVDRPNISLFVERFSDLEKKQERAIELIQKLKGPGIVYTNTRRAAEDFVHLLQERGMEKVAYYHGGMEQDERLLVQKQFIYSQLDLIVCTNAFGMGINKSDIRFVLHLHTPSNLESYVQEMGRAGRDLKPSAAILLFHDHDLAIPLHFIKNELPESDQIEYVLSDSEVLNGYSYYDRMAMMKMTETAQRFLEYHLNKEGILHESSLKEEQRLRIKESLKEKIQERKLEKGKQLNEMEQWVSTDKCKRTMLLHYFGEYDDVKINNCCSNCEGKLDAFFGKNDEQHMKKTSWDEELRRIFRLGVTQKV